MSEVVNKSCTICNTEMVGEYCHDCGQRRTGKRLTLITLIKDTFFSLFDLEKSGLATLLLLISNPRIVIESYWEGYRRYYVPPGKLIAFAALVVGIHIIVHDNLIFGLMFTDSPQWFFLVFFLVLLTVSSYLTYLRLRGNFLEHAVANIYLFCVWTTIVIVLYEAVTYFTGDNWDVSYSTVFILIVLILVGTARTFCRTGSWIRIVLSALAQLVVVISLFAFLTLLLYLLTDVNINF